MRGYVRLTDREIEHLYSKACELAESWKDQWNPDIHLAPMGEREIGEEALRCEVQGVRGTFDLGARIDELKRLIPGSTITSESQPNGKSRFWAVIPIWEREYSNGHKHAPVSAKTPGRPSDTYLMFLCMVEVFLGTVLFFRWQ